MKKILIVMMAVVMAMAMFTGCGSNEKSHTGHLARHEPAKINMFDGSLMTLK